MQASHYGIGGGTSTGQIRANQFMPGRSTLGQNWELREYRLARTCTRGTTGCKLVMNLATVKTTPFDALTFGTDAQSQSFQTAFLDLSPALTTVFLPPP